MSNTLVCPHCGARMNDAPLEPTLSERLQGGGAKKKTRDERNPMSAVLTKDEAAAELKVSLSTLNRLVASGKLRIKKVGALVRIRREWLNEYMREQG